MRRKWKERRVVERTMPSEEERRQRIATWICALVSWQRHVLLWGVLHLPTSAEHAEIDCELNDAAQTGERTKRKRCEIKKETPRRNEKHTSERKQTQINDGTHLLLHSQLHPWHIDKFSFLGSGQHVHANHQQIVHVHYEEHIQTKSKPAGNEVQEQNEKKYTSSVERRKRTESKKSKQKPRHKIQTLRTCLHWSQSVSRFHIIENNSG